MSLLELKNTKGKTKTSWVTCYDYSSAKIVAQSPINGVLVGDSAAMTILGEPNTLNITPEFLVHLTLGVSRGLKGQKWLVSDLPFPLAHAPWRDTLRWAGAFLKAGAQAVKIEGAGRRTLKTIERLIEAGIPVIGHIGLTPQFIHQLGGFKVQGKTTSEKERLIQEAKALEQVGCFAIVLEGMPVSLASSITKAISIPTIGIGAGSQTDGQILVWQDLLGFDSKWQPKFVRAFFSAEKRFADALISYHNAIQQGDFPSAEESYDG